MYHVTDGAQNGFSKSSLTSTVGENGLIRDFLFDKGLFMFPQSATTVVRPPKHWKQFSWQMSLYSLRPILIMFHNGFSSLWKHFMTALP